MKVRYDFIETLSEDLLSKFNQHQLPIDIEGIISNLNIQLFKDAIDDSISGAAIIKNGERKIIINTALNECNERRRFTMGHELGHIMLHADSKLKVDQEILQQMYFRDGHSSQGSDPKEVEANYFSACILMPRSAVYEQLKNYPYINDSAVLNLAQTFGVSVLSMSIRLGKLGIA